MLVVPADVEIALAPATDDASPGVRFDFTLPAGSFATQLCRELQHGDDDSSAAGDGPSHTHDP
jgi:tRNA(Glu) U13 pseudouridine synthase TruD